MLFTEDTDGTDVVTAHACLRLHICHLEQQARSRDGLRALLKERQAGTKALSWFLSGHHEQAESLDRGLILTMAFCIVGEGLTSV